MRTLSEIDAEIAKVSAELQDVHGREAEVYTRIVGYYRSVRNWNKGKREEYGIRRLFETDANSTGKAKNEQATIHIEKTSEVKFCFDKEQIARVELYTRETCPNCPAVVEYCNSKNLKANEYDVDTKIGFELASKNEVRTAPTVICYDKNGTELTRAYSIGELQKIF